MDKQFLTSPSLAEQSACTPPQRVEKKGRMHIDKRTTSYGRRRMQFMTSKAQIKETCSTLCCIKNCLAGLGVKKMTALRIRYFGLNREEQDYYLNAAITQLKSDQVEYYLGSMQICRSAFKIIHGLGNARLARVQKRLRCFRNPRLIGPVGQMAVSWMENYFAMNAEVLPTSGKMHLMDNYTRYEVFSLYKEDILESNEKFASYSHFSRLWKNFFNNVKIPKKVRMGVCSVCANLKSRRQRATNSSEQGTRLLIIYSFIL